MPFNLFGKKAPTDIELPNERGRRDKRLPPPSAADTLRSSYETLRRLATPASADDSPSMRALKQKPKR